METDIDKIYHEEFYKKLKEVEFMVDDGELSPIEDYDEFSLESKLFQDAWAYLEHYTPDGAGEDLARKQGYLEGVCYVVRKLGGECSY